MLALAVLLPVFAWPVPQLTPTAAGQVVRDSSGKSEVDGQHEPEHNTFKLRVSSFPDRFSPVALAGTGVSGYIYVFVESEVKASQVRFFLDHPRALLEDPSIAGQPLLADRSAPYDFSGTAANGSAAPLDTRQLANGRHTITAAVDLPDGRTAVASARFIVHNAARAVLFGADPLVFSVNANSQAFRMLNLFASDGAAVPYALTVDAPWLTVGEQGGSTPASVRVSVDATGLAPGRYSATITGGASGYISTNLPVTLVVRAAGGSASSRSSTSSSDIGTMALDPDGTCTPVPCEQVKVLLPYELDFSQDHGKTLDANGVGTGFTWIDQPTNGTGYIAQNLAVNKASPGTLTIATTQGIMYLDANSQDNALSVGIDGPSQISVLKTTLRNPPAGSGNFEQGGLWFGNNQDNYAKLEVISGSTGTQIEFLMEVNGLRSASTATGALTLANATVTLTLRANPSDKTISAFYSINGGAQASLATFTAPPEFFSFDAAGIDPRIGTRTFGGIFATQRNSTTPLSYTFDDFSVAAGQTDAPPPSSDGVSFDRVSFPVPYPTSMVWGPDNRLYVTEMYGKIHAFTLNEAKQMVADQVINTLGSRLTLGITVDPLSTPDNVILWLAHSNPSENNGELNSSTVTRLSGSGFTTRQDVITGLPRAIANHAINSLHFGPDGKLYIVVGGNTGAGAPNTATTEFGTRAEQPLSAALLVADVHAAGFDGTCATPENTYGPAPCNVTVYASGLRNAYDFVFHSNGQIYSPDNGLGVTGTFPPQPAPPCEGYASTAAWDQGGQNPGEQPDILLRLEQGKYYGHPNPYRNECVYKDGRYQNVAPLPNYVAPIHDIGAHTSTNGAIEYTAGTFGGTLRGELLMTNYSVGDDIIRVKLSADGLSVIQARSLVGGFNNPLPLVEGPDGTIYVGEHGGSKVTALIPNDPGSWTTKQSMPGQYLDLGGAALNGKFYVVAGKTSAGPQSTMFIYDPTTDSWTPGPNRPGTAVENPAVVALNDKLYVFGGSTQFFSGAVAEAHVFDPATSTWSALAPMQAARAGAAAQTIGGKIYLAGGMDGSGSSLASVEVYDPATNTWGSAAVMTSRRDNPMSVVLNGMLYLFGGRIREANGTTVNGTLNTAESYDPATNTWTAIAPMPTGRRTGVVGILNGRVQVMGGEITSSGGAFPQNEEYNPTTNTWRTLTSMLSPRHGAAAATIDGVVYVAGGGITGGSSFSALNEAFAFGATTPPSPDTTPPTVTNVTPADAATGVGVTSNVAATFSEGMDGATLTTSTFTLVKQGTTTAVAATVTYNATSKTATLDPSTDLEAGVTYSATVVGGTSGAKDAAGNPLAADTIWSFTIAPVSAPTNLTLQRSGGKTTTYIDLKWTDNSKVEMKYVIERATSSGFTSNLVTYEVGANTDNYHDTALQSKTTYYYRVFAVAPDGTTRSASSNVASATTK